MAYTLQLKSLMDSKGMEQMETPFHGGPAPAQLKACSLVPLEKKEVEGVQEVDGS